MENIIVNVILKLESLEKEYGKLGTIVALLILAVTTITAIGIICLTVQWWLSVVEWVLPKISNGWRLK